jgi:hypothetical protein
VQRLRIQVLNVAVADQPDGPWSAIEADVLASPGFRVIGWQGLASFAGAGGPTSQRVTAGH